MKLLAACCVALIALTASVTYAAPALDAGSRAPDFSLKDQFGKPWSLSDLSGTVTVLVVANSDSGRAMGPWVDNLKSQYGNKIQVLGLLDLHTVPGIGRGIARSRIKGETKDPLMLDFNGSTASAYGVSGKYPVVVVIDKSGIVRAVTKTNYDPASYNSITSAVKKSLGS